jgi:hypothetical protein
MIKYPLLCTTLGAKMAWIERAMELFRLERNIMGRWYTEGLTLTQYQKLRADTQILFPYQEGKLSKSKWEEYLKIRYEVKTRVLLESEGVLKQSLSKSTRFSPNLDSDIS